MSLVYCGRAQSYFLQGTVLLAGYPALLGTLPLPLPFVPPFCLPPSDYPASARISWCLTVPDLRRAGPVANWWACAGGYKRWTNGGQTMDNPWINLQWRTLEQRRTDCRLVLLFQIIHGLVQIPATNYLQPSLNTTSRKNHNYTYQQCSTRTNYFKYSFFPYTTVIWNNPPYQLVNSPSVISFKAQVSKLQHIRE